MARLVLAGDAHGNTAYLLEVLERARHVGAAAVIQLGDFGFWPGEHDYLDAVTAAAEHAGVALWVVDGNHDYPGDRDDPTGYRHRQTGRLNPTPGTVSVAARGQLVSIGGVRVGFCGGAASIDTHRRSPGRNWWADELLTETDLDRVRSGGPADLWLTHDSAHVPPGFAPLELPEPTGTYVATQRQRMGAAFDIVRPRLHIHGHWHRRYRAATPYGEVLGLASEDADAGFCVVDLYNGAIHLVDR